MTGHLLNSQDTPSLHVFEVPSRVGPNFVPPPEKPETGTPVNRSPSNRLRRMELTS